MRAISSGCLVLGLMLTLVPASRAQEVTLECLRSMDRCALDELFRSGKAVAPPVGYSRGHVLVFSDCFYRCPKLSAALSGSFWKGKHFNCDGTIVNQFAGVKMIGSCIATEKSWFDGADCIAIDYPPGTPIFADWRDEIREVGCGLYLARLYSVCSHEFRGYLALVPERCR
jgi:hypothetical protein